MERPSKEDEISKKGKKKITKKKGFSPWKMASFMAGIFQSCIFPIVLRPFERELGQAFEGFLQDYVTVSWQEGLIICYIPSWGNYYILHPSWRGKGCNVTDY